MTFRSRKHKGHDLPYDVKIMRSQQSYQELCQVHFCRTMFVDIADTTVPNLNFESCNFSRENTNRDVSVFMFDLRMINMSSECEYD
jgi:hypothetical protein